MIFRASTHVFLFLIFYCKSFHLLLLLVSPSWSPSVSLNNIHFLVNIRASTFKALAHNLTNLEELNQQSANLNFIPSIYFMNSSSSLTSLDFDSCNLPPNMPETIFRLPNLQELLVLSNNLAFSGSLLEFKLSSLGRWISLLTYFSIDLIYLLKKVRSLSHISW